MNNIPHPLNHKSPEQAQGANKLTALQLKIGNLIILTRLYAYDYAWVNNEG